MSRQNTQKQKKKALFPDYPRETDVLTQDNKLSVRWSLALSNVFQGLQKNFTPEGWKTPPLPIDEITSIEQKYQPFIGKVLPQNLPDISGQMLYDKNNHVPKIFVIVIDPNTNLVTSAGWKTFTIT